MKKLFMVAVWLLVVGMALHLRTAGLFRGLADEQVYHPDEPKQVTALWRYLHDRYEWHIGSVFYDGYPYGLNHVDEWILRPLIAVSGKVVSHWAPEEEMPEVPGLLSMFYIARSLRVLYGMVCLLLAYLVAKQFRFSSPALWLMVLLLALAPISISVAHFATGDIGTDLFATLMLLFLCFYSKSHKSVWLFLAGMSVGMSFACKYNGLLCGGAVGIYLLVQFIVSRDWKWMGLSAVKLAAGVLAGIVLLTPTLIIDFEQTCKDIYANFVFIRNYGSGEWYDAMDGLQKVSYILTKNVPKILGQIGWCVAAMALLGSVIAGSRVKSALKRHADQLEISENMLIFAVCVYPFIALFLSLAGKPEVQPFHFSYLQIPLTIGAVYGVSWLGRRSTVQMILVIAVCVLELGVKAERDNFFWGKQDNTFIENEMSWHVFSDDGRSVGCSEFIKNIFLEPESASVFRNRKSEVYVNGGKFWENIQAAPVPSIPYPVQNDWIFADGPVFPRNDRMFKLLRDTSESRYVVVYGVPGELSFGVRSGSWPVEVQLMAGSVRNDIILAPNSQDTVTIKPSKYRHIGNRGEFDKDVYVVPINIAASVGDAYVTLLTGKADKILFDIFGGVEEAESFEMPSGITQDRVVEEVARTKYFDSGKMDAVILDSSDVDTSEALLPSRQGHEPVGFPLPCGAFTMELDVVVLSELAEFELCIDDMRRLDAVRQSPEKFSLSKGHHVVQYNFIKSFAPYQCCVVSSCADGRMRINSWKLAPAAERILKGLDSWRENKQKPEWLCRFAVAEDTRTVVHRDEIVFGDSVKLNYFDFPSVVKPGQVPEMRCGMDLIKYPFADFGEYFVFVHIVDKEGRQVYATGFPLSHAVAVNDAGLPVLCGKIDAVPPGEYTVETGIWNSRTGDRLRPARAGLTSRERRKRTVSISSVTVDD